MKIVTIILVAILTLAALVGVNLIIVMARRIWTPPDKTAPMTRTTAHHLETSAKG